MITFSNIPDTVQETLFDRMDMLDKNKRTKIGELISTDTGSPKQNYMFSRSTFMRMISLQPPVARGGGIGKPVILSGGEADYKGNLVSNLWGAKTKYGGDLGLDPRTVKLLDPQGDIFRTRSAGSGHRVDLHGKYWAEGDSQPFRPMPGVKDISVEYKGGGRTLAATRGAEINWTCWTYDDLDRLTAHFLHTGNTVFIDWGWSGIGDISPINVDPFPILKEKSDGELEFSEPYVDRKGKKVPLLSTLPDHIINQRGNYDAMIGIVQDFEWSVRDDGGFDCVTTLISTGVNILQQSLKTSSDPRLASLPTIIKDTHEVDKDYDNTGANIAIAGLTGTAVVVAAVMWWNPIGWLSAAVAGVGVLISVGGGMAYDAMFASDKVYITPTLLKEFRGQGQAVPPRSDASAALEVQQENIWGQAQTNTHYIGSFKGPELLKKMSPYITFDIYIKDLYEQLRNTLTLDEGVIKSGHIIRVRAKVDPGFHNDQMSTPDLAESDENTRSTATHQIDEMYVTWGWFEDNVLSRFFSRLTDNGQGVMGEFRSYEEVYDKSGTFSENVPVKIRNHPSMLTTDFTKFLLLKKGGDPIASWVEASWKVGWWKDTITSKAGESIDVWKKKNVRDSDGECTRFQGFGKETFLASPIVSFVDEYGNKRKCTSGVKLHYFDDHKVITHDDGTTHVEYNSDSGILRNVYFNVRHLAEIMSDGDSIESAVRNVWQDFSAEYGGIYDFYLDYSDDQNRIVVKDRGWSLAAVKNALKKDNRSHPVDPDGVDMNTESNSKFDGLFEFPTWQKNSIVKSQNLSARLPDRMKLVAMYGASNLSDEEDSFESSHHEDQAGLAWGQLVAPIDPELELERGNLTDEEYEQKVLTAAMLGKIDYPWRNNRSFGSKTANIDRELYIQQLSGIPDEFNSGPGTGTIMYDSIIQKIMDNQYAEYIQNLKELTVSTKGNELIGENTNFNTLSAELRRIEKRRKDIWTGSMKLKSGGELTSEVLFNMYQVINMESTDGIYHRMGGSLGQDGYGESHPLKLSSAFKQFMVKEISGYTGIQAKTDPIVPIEFEIDVDGIAGIFPGNAFQSSYLPEKYKTISCFQVVGVNQKLDSSGWTSTVKGQIRISVPPGTAPEMESDVDYETFKDDLLEKLRRGEVVEMHTSTGQSGMKLESREIPGEFNPDGTPATFDLYTHPPDETRVVQELTAEMLEAQLSFPKADNSNTRLVFTADGIKEVDKNLSVAQILEANMEPDPWTPEQVYNLSIEAGVSPADSVVFTQIAAAESGLDITNSTFRSGLMAKTGEDSVGLFQINWGYHTRNGVPDWMKNLGIHTREDLYDASKNMAAAKYLYDGRGGAGGGPDRFEDWSVWKSGIYENYPGPGK